MRICIGAQILRQSMAGIHRYTLNLIRSLSDVDHENEYFLILENNLPENLVLGDNFTVVLSKRRTSILFSWTQIQLPYLLIKMDIDIFHCLTNWEFPFYKPCKYVITIHDLYPLLFSQDFCSVKDLLHYKYYKILTYFIPKKADAAITVVNKDSLKGMLHFLVHHVTVEAVGPRLVYPDGSLQKSYSTQFPSLAMILSHHGLLKDPDPPHKTVLKKPIPVACLMGACLMLRRRAIEDIGPIDKAFFLAYEEADGCYRLNKSSWLVYCLPQFTVVHYQGQSEKLIPGKGIIETQISLQYYLRKHYGILIAILEILLMISIHSIWFIKNETKAMVFGGSERIEYHRAFNKCVLLGQIPAIKHFLSSIMSGSGK